MNKSPPCYTHIANPKHCSGGKQAPPRQGNAEQKPARRCTGTFRHMQITVGDTNHSLFSQKSRIDQTTNQCSSIVHTSGSGAAIRLQRPTAAQPQENSLAQESNIGANIGTPRVSRPYTTFRVTFGFEIMKTASALLSLYAS